MSQLGRVVDPDALDAAAGPRGFHALTVPADWLAEGAVVELILPSRLACARCDGGGCDGCERSGAIRLAGEEPARTFQLTLPRGAVERTLVRLVRPLGDDAGLEQLALELRAGDEANASCRRLDAPAPAASMTVASETALARPARVGTPLTAAVLVALAIAIAAVLSVALR